MTKAVCVFCGDMKFGAFNACKACSRRPTADDDVILSLAMTDHYFSDSDLSNMGCNIKLGKPPKLDEETRKNLQKTLDNFKLTPAGRAMFGATFESGFRKPKKWWKIW